MNKRVAMAAFGLVFSVAVCAEGEIYATNLDGLIQADGQGMYDKVLKLLNLKYQSLPAARAESEMTNTSGCMFPIDRTFMKISGDFIQSDLIDVVNINIYSLKGGLETLSDLTGKSIGLRLGLNYGPKINALQKSNVRVELAPNLESTLKKLQAGRIDAVLEFQTDVEEFQKTHPGFDFKSSKAPVAVHNDAMTCYNNPVNQKLIVNYNEALKKHRKEVDKMIGK